MTKLLMFQCDRLAIFLSRRTTICITYHSKIRLYTVIMPRPLIGGGIKSDAFVWCLSDACCVHRA